MSDTNTYRGDELVPIGIAARILGVSIDTVRRWDAAGHIRARRTPGGQRRFVVSELRALVDAA